ncbi:MAG: hypothetical protein JKY75_06410 [Erythrobacter sp.]|nr:hypothetical protein [Erythrobacter sp.]
MNRMLANAGHDRLFRARTTSLPLENAHARVEWVAPPPEDVLARLLLELIGEEELKEIFNG